MINYEEFRQYVLDQYPKEACGLIVNDTFIPIANTHPHPDNNFRIEPGAYLDYDGLVECIVHSHTIKAGDKHKVDPRTPSISDLQLYKHMRIKLGIVATDGQDVNEMIYVPKTEEGNYIRGANDSFTLLDLPYHPLAHSEEIMNRRIPGFFIANGYKYINEYELKDGDLILFRLSNEIDHLGVYLGNDRMLTQRAKQKAKETSYSKWARQATHWLRKKK